MVGKEWRLFRHRVISGASQAQYDAGSRHTDPQASPWSEPVGTSTVGSWLQESPFLPRDCPGSLGHHLLLPTWGPGQEAAQLQHSHTAPLSYGDRGWESWVQALPPAVAGCGNLNKAFLPSGSQFSHL